MSYSFFVPFRTGIGQFLIIYDMICEILALISFLSLNWLAKMQMIRKTKDLGP